MKNRMQIRKMVRISILTAMVVILQLLSSFIKFGPFSATLALIPLIMGAIIYGPLVGTILGLTMGVVILATDAQAFFVVNPFFTILLCLVKTAVAGLVSGYIYKALAKKNKHLGIILAALAAPIVNTGLFALGTIAFFYNTLVEWAGGSNALSYLFLTMIGFNFLIEFSLNAILSPTFIYLTNVLNKNIFNIESVDL